MLYHTGNYFCYEEQNKLSSVVEVSEVTVSQYPTQFPYFYYSERLFLSAFRDFIKHIYQFHQGRESNTSSFSAVILYPAALLFVSFLFVTCPEILMGWDYLLGFRYYI